MNPQVSINLASLTTFGLVARGFINVEGVFAQNRDQIVLGTKIRHSCTVLGTKIRLLAPGITKWSLLNP